MIVVQNVILINFQNLQLYIKKLIIQKLHSIKIFNNQGIFEVFFGCDFFSEINFRENQILV